jgi:hypothetical protein
VLAPDRPGPWRRLHVQILTTCIYNSSSKATETQAGPKGQGEACTARVYFFNNASAGNTGGACFEVQGE